MNKLISNNGSTNSYDAIGNPTGDGTWTYTWEKGRQLKKMSKTGTTAEFKYNADGLRVQKKVTVSGTATTTNYILHGKNIVHMTRGSTALHFWYDAQNRPAIVPYGSTRYAYVHNLQGDIVGIIDSTGTEVVKYTYDAWGKVLSTTGSLASTLGTVQPFRYRGYVYDVETGLYYLRSRYYNPEWGRFINADALIKGNLYCYCKNEPIKKNDPDGLYEWSEDGCGGGGFYPWWNFNTFIPHGSSTMAINLDTPEVVSIASDISSSYYVEKNALQYEEQWINSVYNISARLITPVISHYLHRPYIRVSIRKLVEERAQKLPDGRFLDANTKLPINGTYDLGHVYGKEFFRLRDYAEKKLWTQSQFNDYMNDPELYQIEDPISNRSHIFEMK